MSQYPYPPSPYQQPQYTPPAGAGYDPAHQLLGPARNAGLLSIIVGGLLIVCGAGCIGIGALVPFDQVRAEQPALFEQFDAQFGEDSANMMKWILITMGIITVVPAVLMIILGIFARRGGLGPIVTLMVLTILMLLGGVAQLVGSLLQGGGDPNTLIGTCIMVIPLALLAVLMYFLIAAARAAPQVRMMRDQYQSQFWQYQQNQQAYGQQPQHWQAPPPPPPPPQNPPPPPPQ
jgi:hypothetical protein